MSGTGFVHQALCYGSDDEFLEGTLASPATALTPATGSSPSSRGGHLPPDPRAARGHGPWAVRQLGDLVTERLAPAGSVVRLYFKRDPVR